VSAFYSSRRRDWMERRFMTPNQRRLVKLLLVAGFVLIVTGAVILAANDSNVSSWAGETFLVLGYTGSGLMIMAGVFMLVLLVHSYGDHPDRKNNGAVIN
jgi:hypothetical protein